MSGHKLQHAKSWVHHSSCTMYCGFVFSAFDGLRPVAVSLLLVICCSTRPTILACSPNPCRNGGTCIPGDGPLDFNCRRVNLLRWIFSITCMTMINPNVASNTSVGELPSNYTVADIMSLAEQWHNYGNLHIISYLA